MELVNRLKFLNKLSIGITLSVVLPTILYFIIVHGRFQQFNIEHVNYSRIMMMIMPLLLSRCVFPNVILFFLFIWLRYDKAAKGVLIATAILSAALLILKFAF